MNLSIIYSHSKPDIHIWEDVLAYDERMGALEPSEDYKFEIISKTMSWKNFKKEVSKHDFFPLVVYAVRHKDNKGVRYPYPQLCVYEVLDSDVYR